MEAFELILLLLAAVLLSSVIDQIVPKISSPLIQIGLGLLISLFSISPLEIAIDPELFLVLLVAPLLFYEAKAVNKVSLWKNKRPVISLAIGLVVVTTLVVGFYVHWIVPSIPLAAAFALGAALGPTDAVAVSSLSKDANIDSRQKNILEGESLINDASGIVSFQFALAAAVTGTFYFLDAVGEFLYSFFGGIIIGLVIAYLTNFLVKKARANGLENTTFHVLVELFMPFIVYLAAFWANASGILAVVAAGLVMSITPRDIGPSISRLNIVSSSVWQVSLFILNGIVFVLLGAQLPGAMETTWQSSQTDNLTLIFEVITITVMLLTIRFTWVYIMDRIFKKEPEATLKERIRTATIMTLAGPKGAITLSIMITIPYLFPNRSFLLFLASGVIILTLLLATFVVPLLAPKAKVDPEKQAQETEVLTEILRNVIEDLTARETKENRLATQIVIRSYNDRLSRAKESTETELEHNKELRIKVLAWEQDYVLDMIEKGEVEYIDGYQYLNRLARIQNLIKHRNNLLWTPRNIGRHFLRHTRSTLKNFGKLKKCQETEKHRGAMRNLQEKTVEYVIAKLQDEISNPEAPTENVSALLLEYQQILTRLRNPRPSVTSIARSTYKVTEIARLGLNLELEQIQTMYENERLSRTSAKHLRENVYLMQIDLEDRI